MSNADPPSPAQTATGAEGNSGNSRSLISLIAVAFALLSAFMVLLIGGIITWRDFETKKSLAIAEQALFAAHTAARISEQMVALITTLSQTAYDVAEAMSLDKETDLFNRQLTHALGNFRSLQSVAILNGQGVEIAKMSRIELASKVTFVDHSQTPLWRTIQASKVYVGSRFSDKNTGAPAVHIAVPVDPGRGKVSGGVAGELSLRFLWDLLAPSKIGRHNAAYVVDRNGTVLGHTALTQVLRPVNISPALIDAVFSEDRGFVARETVNSYGARVLSVAVPLHDPDWAVVYEVPLSAAYNQVFRGLGYSLAIMAVVAVMAAIFGVILARRLTRPLAKLTTVATSLAAGDFTESAPVSGALEVERLSEAFRQISVNLGRALQDLDRARIAAVDANQAKSSFLANMSHELRTPLNSIIGFSEMMQHEVKGELPRAYREYTDLIATSGRLLLETVNSILDLAKIEAGKLDLYFEPVLINTLLEETVTLLQIQAMEKKVDLRQEIEGARLLSVDPIRIKQTFLNVIGNALKFTDQGSVTVRGEDGPFGYRVLIADTGIGMTAEQIDIALKPFGQAHGTSLVRRFQGTGLGLSLSHEIMLLHGGELRIDSKAGKGTIVTLVFPIDLAAPSTAEKR
ncbi:MAG: sensor histidine kinase [Magnetospiraceae bacterium]